MILWIYLKNGHKKKKTNVRARSSPAFLLASSRVPCSASGVVLCFVYTIRRNFVQISVRDSLAAQLEITLTKADSEQLARSIAEEQYSDLEKEKIMKELELKEMMARHRQEVAEKDITISSVRNCSLDFTYAKSAASHTS